MIKPQICSCAEHKDLRFAPFDKKQLAADIVNCLLKVTGYNFSCVPFITGLPEMSSHHQQPSHHQPLEFFQGCGITDPTMHISSSECTGNGPMENVEDGEFDQYLAQPHLQQMTNRGHQQLSNVPNWMGRYYYPSESYKYYDEEKNSAIANGPCNNMYPSTGRPLFAQSQYFTNGHIPANNMTALQQPTYGTPANLCKDVSTLQRGPQTPNTTEWSNT